MVSEVDVFEGQIRDWAAVNGIDLTVYRVVANFGAYGSLPIFVGVYQSGSDTGFVLIDGVNGEVDGPFVSGSAIDPRGLLVLHGGAFVSGTGVQVVDAKTGGCVAAAPTWHPSPPFGAPATWIITWTTPGWRCFLNNPATGTSCKCRREGTGRDPDGRIITVRETCDCTCAAPPGPGAIPAGPGLTPPPALGCTPCAVEYLY